MLKNLEALRVFFKSGRVFVTAGRSLRSIVNRVTRPEINKNNNLLSNAKATDMCHFLIY